MMLMRILLVFFLICSISSALIAVQSPGAQYPGDFNATLKGNALVRVHQWLDVQLQEWTNLVNIFDYGTDYIQSPLTNNQMALIFVYETNAQVNMKVDYSVSANNPSGNPSLLDVKWSLWKWSNSWQRLYPPSLNDWASSGDSTILQHSLFYGLEHYLGLSMKFRAQKDLPAGSYTINYNITFTPTVVFN